MHLVNLRIALLTLAEQTFRDQADQDYIAARAIYPLGLREQFLWAALQACEKYLKGILLFNGHSARYMPGTYDVHRKRKGRPFPNHDLLSLFSAVTAIPDLGNVWPT